MTDERFVGGLAGFNDGIMINPTIFASVTGTDLSTGEPVGVNSGNVTATAVEQPNLLHSVCDDYTCRVTCGGAKVERTTIPAPIRHPLDDAVEPGETVRWITSDGEDSVELTHEGYGVFKNAEPFARLARESDAAVESTWSE